MGLGLTKSFKQVYMNMGIFFYPPVLVGPYPLPQSDNLVACVEVSLRTSENFKMVSQMISCLSQSSSRFCFSDSWRLTLPKIYNRGCLSRFSQGFASRRLFTVNRRKWRSACIFNSGKEPGGEGKVTLSLALAQLDSCLGLRSEFF